MTTGSIHRTYRFAARGDALALVAQIIKFLSDDRSPYLQLIVTDDRGNTGEWIVELNKEPR